MDLVNQTRVDTSDVTEDCPLVSENRAHERKDPEAQYMVPKISPRDLLTFACAWILFRNTEVELSISESGFVSGVQS